MPTTDFGRLAPCFWHRVCGGVVIPGDTMCDTCRTEWGTLIQPTSTDQPSEPQTADTATEYVTTPVDHGPAETRCERRARQESGEQARPNQTCWLCEQRRHCWRIAGRWECATCRDIT